MRIAFYFLFILILFKSGAYAQSVYNVTVNNIEGQSFQMNALANKKALFIVLPIIKEDSAYAQIMAFEQKYGDSVNIVGILSKEEGYDDNKKQAVKEMYAGSRILLTEGMYTKKAAGSNQSPLLQWLTDRTKNHRFDRDAESIGVKFFIGKTGRLYAVLGRQTSLGSAIVNQVVNAR